MERISRGSVTSRPKLPLLEEIIKRKILVIFAAAIGAIGGGLASYLMTPIYRSEILLAPRTNTTSLKTTSALLNLSGLPELAGFPVGAGSKSEEYFAYLSGSSFKLRFIEKHNLIDVLYPKELIKTPSELKTEQDALRILNSDILTISKDKLTGLIKVSFDWKDPKIAAGWASTYVLQANQELATRDASEMDRQIAFAEMRLGKTKQVEIRQTLLQLLAAQLRARTMIEIHDEYAFVTVDQPVIADIDKPIRPRPVGMILAGAALFSGLTVAFLLLLTINHFRPPNQTA